MPRWHNWQSFNIMKYNDEPINLFSPKFSTYLIQWLLHFSRKKCICWPRYSHLLQNWAINHQAWTHTYHSLPFIFLWCCWYHEHIFNDFCCIFHRHELWKRAVNVNSPTPHSLIIVFCLFLLMNAITIWAGHHW